MKGERSRAASLDEHTCPQTPGRRRSRSVTDRHDWDRGLAVFGARYGTLVVSEPVPLRRVPNGRSVRVSAPEVELSDRGLSACLSSATNSVEWQVRLLA
jgi:hypothetical protein